MKNKPLRHKEENTFKFQPFAERISNIDVDIFHRVPHANEAESEEIQCFFYQTLQKWNVLNLTESYDALRKELYGIITLPQLLHRKEQVVEALLRHIKQKNPLSLQPLLELIVSLSKDLQKEFYLYYLRFFDQLIDLLNTKDTDVLEWTLVCLAYLFKNLWRYLTRDINVVFVSLLPLLSNKRPEYINNFAAESFAFVARKVKDRQAFLALILSSVKNEKDGISGCGKLLFEVVHGVQHSFHSCAETTLQFYFESLTNEQLPHDILFEVLEQIIHNVTKNIKPKNTGIYWNTIINSTEKSMESPFIDSYLKLVIQTLEYNSGKMLYDPENLIKLYLKLLQMENNNEETLRIVSKLGSLILMSDNVQLKQEHASNTVRKSLLITNKVFFMDFIRNLIDYSSFDALVLPVYLKYFTKNMDEDSIRLLTEIVVKKSEIKYNGIDLNDWKRYPLEFGAEKQNIVEYFIKNIQIGNDIDDLNTFICSLICIPHVNGMNNESVWKILQEIIQKTINNDNFTDNNRNVFMFANVLLCFIHITNREMIYSFVNQTNLINILLENVCNGNVTILNLLDLIVTSLKQTEIVSMKTLSYLHEKLSNLLSSPYHEVRLLTTHIYTIFEELSELPSKKTDETIEKWSVFNLCFETESIELSVQTYRNQLRNLERLSCDKIQGILCKDTDFVTVPLRYLLGVLYMNFQLLWDPVVEIVASYANGITNALFWEVFYKQLTHCTEYITNRKEVHKNDIEFGFFNELYMNFSKITNTPDYVNYRLLLWKAMCRFPEVVEAKNRDVVPIVLSFVENEYKSVSDVSTLNIKQNTETELEDETDEDVNEDKNEENDVITSKKLSSSVSGGKTYLKTLLHQLQFFSKIRNPKSVFREPELYKIYLEFLSNRNEDVQKSALDCIMVYKHKYLLPYKENLYGLIDEKQFKNQLSLFRIDKENSIVENHRNDLIPIVLRIVFGKMVTKTGLRTGGKSAGQTRRNLILRFLAGCQENEMIRFIEMLFKYYQGFITNDPGKIIENVINDIDLTRFVPPKRLLSSLNLLTVIIDQFGGLMSQNLLSYILKILLIIGSYCLGGFNRRNEIHSGYLNSLKNVRSGSMNVLKRFFEQFDSYSWSKDEVNAMFTVFIRPWIGNLTTENVNNATPMLKLFVCWGQNPKYFPLLVKQSENNEYALKSIIDLFSLDKLHPSVVNIVVEVLEKLLLLKPGEDEIVLDVNDLVPVENDIVKRLDLKEINYGSSILLPFVPRILERLKRKLSHKNKGVNAKETFILSRISELVLDPEICDTVLTLLLPIIVKKAGSNASEESLVQLMTTVNNLMKIVTKPEKNIRKLAPLFADINSIPARKLLSDTLNVISKKNPEFEVISRTLSHLNAFDTRWIDQPDFEKRLKSFKLVNEEMENDTISIEFGGILIYNCFHFVKHEKDLALRESSSMCLRNLTLYLIKKFDNNDYLLNEIVLDLIRRGITSKNDNYRHETISLLGHISRECPTSHNTLTDLSKLTNKTDLEVDFFENLIHLQLYRQTRALNKFVQIYNELKTPPNVRTLTQFILPLTSWYLLSEKYNQKNSLIDASIEALKTITRLLPWHQYESVLKFYLSKLKYKKEFQKQLVRIVVAVLDSYHFDLSKANLENVTMKQSQKPEGSDKVEEDDVENDKKLEDIMNETEPDTENDVVETSDIVLPINRQTVLSPSAAKRVIHSIQNVLLPQLHRTMAELTVHEASHKINRKKTGIEREEEELQKIPISLAVVKLLQRLPVHILQRNLPGIFMKLCSFFKSHLESVRRMTRETLQKIMTSLGPDYLGLLIGEMTSMLSRGFQIHVLVYSVHSVLVSMKELFKEKDIDKCLGKILELCKVDLFGSVSEEKEVAKIGSKVSEAKSTKSFDTFQILAQYITEKCLLDLVLPLKEVLNQTHSFKIVNKVQECLRRIVLGLVDNTFISTHSLLVFAYGTSSESIPQFMARHTKKQLTDEEREKKSRQRTDCFIIPKAPVGRSGVRNKNIALSSETNSHLLVEFGLRLCFFILKRDKIETDNYISYIDPFVVIFKNCLTSRHVKMSTLTLQCLTWVVKYETPSMKEHIKDITKSIFDLLHKYAAAGLSKGDNFDLVVAAFKTTSIIVRDVKYYTIDTDQLKALLIYAEQDLHDFERQSTAFALLKSIISRKLIVPEIHDVMKKVSELSITSDVPHIRLQSRQVFHQFLMDYPLGKKLDTHLSFYMSQLSYELQPGRKSALEMVQTIVSTFPLKILKQQCGMFFVMLGARLINDEAPECRKMVAKSIQTMLERLTKSELDNLFDIVKSWFKDKKISHRRLAAQLCGIIVLVEKEKFTSRLPEIVPDIIKQFSGDNDENGPGKFVKIVQTKPDNDAETKPQDHHLFQVLQLLLKISNHCPTFLKNVEDIEILSSYIQRLLAYPHEWVRLASTQFIGYVLSTLDITHLSELLQTKKYDEKGYLYSDPQTCVKSLTLDLCDQLQPGVIKAELAEQVVKNLVFMARVLQNVVCDDVEDEADVAWKPLNLLWLTRRMRKIVNYEIVQASKSIILRTEVFKWIAGVVTTIETDKLHRVLHNLLAPLVREMATTEDSNTELRQLAKEVGGIIKKKIGHETYLPMVSKLQLQLNVKRAERKRERTQLTITNPEMAAKKKIKLNEKKKIAKKRKIEGFKGKKPGKKRRKVDDLMDSSEVI